MARKRSPVRSSTSAIDFVRSSIALFHRRIIKSGGCWVRLELRRSVKIGYTNYRNELTQALPSSSQLHMSEASVFSLCQSVFVVLVHSSHIHSTPTLILTFLKRMNLQQEQTEIQQLPFQRQRREAYHTTKILHLNPVPIIDKNY